MRVVLLGAPGSGKGTQACLLATALGVPAISTGEMLRQAVLAGNDLGRRVEGVMAAGQLVDDGLMAEVVRERLAQADASSGFVLDGYPRTLAQSATLDRILAQGQAALDHVVMLEVEEQLLVARARGRGRSDDREDVVRARLTVYAEKTRPLVDHYAARGALVRVDGNRTIPEVTRAIVAALGLEAA